MMSLEGLIFLEEFTLQDHAPFSCLPWEYKLPYHQALIFQLSQTFIYTPLLSTINVHLHQISQD